MFQKRSSLYEGANTPTIANFTRDTVWLVLVDGCAMWTVHSNSVEGPAVRVSPNELIFSDAKAWDDIYGNKVCPNGLGSRIRPCKLRCDFRRSPASKTWRSLRSQLEAFHRG